MVSRNVCWTLNNWTEEEEAQLIISGPVKYICWGREEGEQEGTPHLQGYAEFCKPMRWAGIKKLGGPWARMHLEGRRGTQEQAIDYTRKDNNWVEVGQKALKGARTDLCRARATALEEGMRGVTLTCTHQAIRVAEKFLTYHEEPRDWLCDVHWIWGPSGAGKSKLARELTCDMDTYVKNDGTKWWEGYDAHEAVIIDDFRDSWWPVTEMLSLLDRYEKRVEYKGGTRQFKPRTIVITSVKPPAAHYTQTGEPVKQLLRRITRVTELCNEVGGGNTEAPPPVIPEEEWLTQLVESLLDLGVKPACP